jgi:hypothetical protein
MQIMVATVRCEEIAAEKVAELKSNQVCYSLFDVSASARDALCERSVSVLPCKP